MINLLYLAYRNKKAPRKGLFLYPIGLLPAFHVSDSNLSWSIHVLTCIPKEEIKVPVVHRDIGSFITYVVDEEIDFPIVTQ